MNIRELYKQIPAPRHSEIVVAGDRLFFEGDEYILTVNGELRLVRSSKGLEQGIEQIITKLSIK